MIGTKLSHFEITAKIGEGGMGEVYQATDTKLNREVALKILPETFSHDAERMARFGREAQFLASLNHPNIAAIYGLEETNGTRALVMELVQGEDLAERISRGPIPLEEALPIALQIAEALEDAHEKGIIHRDLKPANVRITPEGKVKILDFGLAKALEEERTSQEVSNSPTLTMAATQAGFILGTAAYMSPEQARGKAVDRRADVWALGVVLFEMLAGRKVFDGEDLSLTLASVMKEEPDWDKLPRDTPSSIKQLLRRCLKKDGRQRLQHIGDARIAIEEYIADPQAEEPEPIVSPHTAFSRKQKLFLVLTVLLTLLLGALLNWELKPEPPAPRPVRLEANISGSEGLNTFAGNSVALSPDGRLLVYRTGTGQEPLRLRSLDSLDSQTMPGTEGGGAPFFSPDGRWVGFSGRELRALKKVSISGGTPVTLCPSLGVLGGTWSPEGVIVFATRGAPLKQVSAAGGTPQELTQLQEGEVQHDWPQFLPGGEQVLFTSYRENGRRIEVFDMESRKRSIVVETGGDYPRYASSGHLLYVDDRTLFAAPFDLHELQTTGEPVPIVADLVMDGVASGAAQYGVSDNGTLFYLTGEARRQSNLIWVDAKGRQTTASPTPRTYVGFSDLSPKGRRLAVGIESNENTDIWVLDLERDTSMRLTFDEASDANPIWSPDGRFLYFVSFRDGKHGIFRKAADGSDEAEWILESDIIFGVRAASDEYLALTKDQDLFLFSIRGKGSSEPEPFLTNPSYEEGSPRFSPKGNWLAYDSNETGRYEVYITSYPQIRGKWQVSSEGGFRPKWSADGKKLFYRTNDAIWVSEVEMLGNTLQISKPDRLVEVEHWYNEGIYGQDLGVDSERDRFLLIGGLGQPEGRNQVTFVFNWFEEIRQLTESNQ